MIWLFAWLTLKLRRNRLRVRLLQEQDHLLRLRPLSENRKVKLQKEGELLKRTSTQLARAASIAACNEIERILQTSRIRCDEIIREEAQLRTRLDEADAKAERYRELAAAFPAKSFSDGARRTRKAVSAEIKRLWGAKNEQIEQRLLTHIEAHAAALEQMVTEAQVVQKTMAELKEELARLPKEQVAINIGSEEVFDEITATFFQVQADAERGNYRKARQRLVGLKQLKDGLVAAMERRRIEARKQVELWLNCGAVVEKFPAIQSFPERMSAIDIEKWYALRPLVEEVVLQRASEQRARNVPTRHWSGYRLSKDHPLRAALQDASNDAKLDAFLRAAKMYG